MASTQNIAEIINKLDALTPLRACGEIGSELNLVVQQLAEQGWQAEALLIDQERQACLLTARATILASYKDRISDVQSTGRYIGLVGYEDGSEWPDPNGFSTETWEHLLNRAETTPNPVLKARYHDLVFEMSKLPQKHSSALEAIDAYLHSAHLFSASNRTRHQMEMINDMDQATHLALRIDNRDKLQTVIETLLSLISIQITQTSEGDKLQSHSIGRWVLDLSRILLYVKRSRKFAALVNDTDLEQIKDIVRNLAEQNTKAGHGYVVGQFLEIAALAARLLKDSADEYALELQRGETMVHQGDESILHPPSGAPRHLIAASFYENAVEHFQQMRDRIAMTSEQRANLQARENELKNKIREMYRLGRNELGSIAVPIEIPPEDLDQMLDPLLAPASLEACLQRIVTEGSLLPNLSLTKETASHSILSHIPMRSLQNNMAVVVTKTDQERESHEVDRNILLWIQVNSTMVLTNLFSRLQEQKSLAAQSFTDYLGGTGVFDEDNLALVQIGIERHFEEDYVSALHILVPQFEDVMRTLFERGGKGVIRPRRGQAGWEVETFGAFFDQEVVKKTLPPELYAYIRLVMTDQIGWNLRNRIAHGLIRPQDCNIVTSVTVLHLFLLLTLFRLTDSNPQEIQESTL